MVNYFLCFFWLWTRLSNWFVKHAWQLTNTCSTLTNILNLFLANVCILYPLEIPKLWFSGVFRGYQMGTLARNGLMLCWMCSMTSARVNLVSLVLNLNILHANSTHKWRFFINNFTHLFLWWVAAAGKQVSTTNEKLFKKQEFLSFPWCTCTCAY